MTTPLTCPKHYLIRDLFLFSCYTGIPYSDMRKLTNEDIFIAEDKVVWIKTSRGENRDGLRDTPARTPAANP